MPHEGLAAKLAAKRSGGRLNSLLEDAALAGGAGAAGVDAPFRARLHSLFAQIEKEFEQLYAENLGRKCRAHRRWCARARRHNNACIDFSHTHARTHTQFKINSRPPPSNSSSNSIISNSQQPPNCTPSPSHTMTSPRPPQRRRRPPTTATPPPSFSTPTLAPPPRV